MQDVTLAGLSLLIVEDEPLLRKQLRAHLEKLGADVTGADTIQAAKRFLADLDFDFVLLDVNLPDGRGTDLLKEKSFRANTGIIVMTAEGAIGGAGEGLRPGGVAFFGQTVGSPRLPVGVRRGPPSKRTTRLGGKH